MAPRILTAAGILLAVAACNGKASPAAPQSSVSPSVATAHAGKLQRPVLCPLDKGLEVRSAVQPASPVALPVGDPGDGRLYGAGFDGPTSYLLAPASWRCYTLQGGSAAEITVGPALPPYPAIPKTYVSNVANYDGAGGVHDIACDWFRWADPLSPTFADPPCGPSSLAKAEAVHPIKTATDEPFMVLVVRPPRTYLPGELRRSGPNTEYDFAVMPRDSDGSYLVGLGCGLPSAVRHLCLQNLRIFLATSALTKSLSRETDELVTRQVAKLMNVTP